MALRLRARTNCPCTEPDIDSQQPVASVSGTPMPSSDPWGHQALMVHIHADRPLIKQKAQRKVFAGAGI